ncbi:MAG: hypothetical protein F4Z08_02850 [Chloroflexi bacterium]|nr:hypothetical protein [Chloroflexota bacterium]
MPQSEIVYRWESEDELLGVLAAQPLPPAQTATTHALVDRTDFDGADVVVYDWRLTDRNGRPIEFPVQLVSDTTVVDDTSDPRGT